MEKRNFAGRARLRFSVGLRAKGGDNRQNPALGPGCLWGWPLLTTESGGAGYDALADRFLFVGRACYNIS